MFRFLTPIAKFTMLGVALTLLSARTAAQEDPETIQAFKLMLERAEVIRYLSAEHIAFLATSDDISTKKLMDDAAQVMAYNTVCTDEELKADILNKIATETTLQISIKIDESPIRDQMTELMSATDGMTRLNLVADVSTATLMFEIGRRRGLFDALLTDFGTQRFCNGMGNAMRGIYYTLASQYQQ